MFIRAVRGPIKGKVFEIEDGMSLGRKEATVNLGDPRASSVHAHIVQTGAGGWHIEDNQSKNGIRNGSGERVDSLELAPGVTFGIAAGEFVVQETATDDPAEVAAGTSTSLREAPTGVTAAIPVHDGAPAGIVLDPEPEPAAEPHPELEVEPAAVLVPKKKEKRAEKPKKQKVYWNDALADFLESNAAKFKDKPFPIVPLDPALVLEFVRGSQVNSRWVIGFGPRKVGPSCADLPIWENGAPPVCFEIFPSPDGLIFKTAYPETVLLNGRAIDNEVLRVGDTITIKETLIEVDFTE